MTFKTEILQGMFSTLTVLVLCKSVIFTIYVSNQFCNVPLNPNKKGIILLCSNLKVCAKVRGLVTVSFRVPHLKLHPL